MQPYDLGSHLGSYPEVTDLLARVFEFDVSSGNEAESFKVSSGLALQTVAGDSAGGTFLLCGPSHIDQTVLYVSSEGQAGVISRNLKEVLELLVGLPCWQDCLTFSGDGDIAVMATTAGHSLRDLFARNPEISSQQDNVAKKLSLARPETAVLLTRLHAAVSATWPDYVISDEEGEYETLFGSFRPDRNPRWR